MNPHMECDDMGQPRGDYVPRSRRSSFRKTYDCIQKKIDSYVDILFTWSSTWNSPYAVRKRKETIRRELDRHRRYGDCLSLSKRWSRTRTLAFWAVAMSATGTRSARAVVFDTDSATIGMDNRCSACISSVIEDFDAPPQPCGRVIKGFGGTRNSQVMQGQIVWRWLDDNGLVHQFRIPNSYFVKTEEVTRLLSPQHLSQELKRQGLGNASETTTDSKCVLSWSGAKFKLTIPLDPSSNVATFRLAPGYERFMAFCAQAEIPIYEEEDIVEPEGDILHAEPAWVVSDDEDDDARTSDERLSTGKQAFDTTDGTLIDWEKPATTDFSLDGPIETHVIPDEEEKGTAESETNTMKLLKIHQRMGHISFHRLQTMAKLGHLPKSLEKCPLPVCSACLYGKQTRRPWRTRSRSSTAPAAAPLQPGDMVSVDQMQSPHPGLIAQMTGRPTTLRYKYATVYVDQGSRLGYVHLQRTADATETLEGKALFEKFASDQGVSIKRYHADNGIFKANAWVEHCRQNNQHLRV